MKEDSDIKEKNMDDEYRYRAFDHGTVWSSREFCLRFTAFFKVTLIDKMYERR